jgi:hypothetical protein
MLNIKKIIDLVVTDTRRAEDDEELLHTVKLAERGALQNPFPIFEIYTESERLPILVDLTFDFGRFPRLGRNPFKPFQLRKMAAR